MALFDESNTRAGYLGIVIALCYWFTVAALEKIGETVLFKPQIRKFLSDFAYPVSNHCLRLAVPQNISI